MRSGRRNGLGSVRPSWLQAFAAQVERDAGALLALIAELNVNGHEVLPVGGQ